MSNKIYREFKSKLERLGLSLQQLRPSPDISAAQKKQELVEKIVKETRQLDRYQEDHHHQNHHHYKKTTHMHDLN